MSERAVVVMGKLPEPGRVKTRLGLPPERAAELYRAFLTDVFETVERALRERPGRAVFACALDREAEHPAALALAPAGWTVVCQRGADLGARMRDAWRAGRARRTVVIGSDLPTLSSARLVEALDHLDPEAPAKVVVIPALDGGYVGIGLTRDQPVLFEGIAWSTPTVLAETEAAAVRAGLEVVRLEPQADVDEPSDLSRLLLEVQPETSTGVALDRLVTAGLVRRRGSE